MPGYSGTPLFKKLGIKGGIRVALLDLPAEVRAELNPALSTCQIDRYGKKPVDFILYVAKSRAGLNDFDHVVKSLAPNGMIWISWPKKSSGVPTDLDENKVRNIGLAGGLVDVKVCAITDVWSGLKFVRRLKDR
jgi:hypothetical protein